MTDTVLVDRADLQRIVNYILQNEEEDYRLCQDEEWTEEQLSHHIYAMVKQLQDCIDSQ
jgi:hypothetical protein